MGVGTCGIADKPMTTYHDTSKYNVRHLMPQWQNILSWCKSILLYSSKIIAYRCVLYGLGYPSKGALKQIACSPLVASLGNCPYQYITQNSRIHNKINDHCNGVAAQIMVVVKLVWVAVSFWMQQRPKKHFHVFNVTHLLSIFQVELDYNIHFYDLVIRPFLKQVIKLILHLSFVHLQGNKLFFV